MSSESILEFSTILPSVRSCSYCHVPYGTRTPVLLACGHTICGQCHTPSKDGCNVNDSSGDISLPSRALQSDSTEEELPAAVGSCPTCAADKGMEQSYRHRGLEAVLAMAAPRRRAEDGLRCVDCSNPFELYCTSCKVSMCSACDQQFHVGWRSEHKRQPYVERTCQLHPGEKLELVCAQDGCPSLGALICLHCTRRGQPHAGHSYEWTRERARQLRLLLREKRQLLWALLQSVNRAVCHLTDLSQDIRTSRMEVGKQVELEMDRLALLIEERRAALHTALQLIADIKATKLRGQAESVADALTPSYLVREQAETIPDKPHFHLFTHFDTINQQLSQTLVALDSISREPCLSPGVSLDFPTLSQLTTHLETAGQHLQVPPSVVQHYPTSIASSSSSSSSS